MPSPSTPSTTSPSSPSRSAPRSEALTPDQILISVRLLWMSSFLVLALPTILDALAITWHPPVRILQAAWLVAMSGSLIVVGELSLAAIRLVRQSRELATAPARVLRIRTPNPQMSAGTLGENRPDGADLWYVAHRLFPDQQRSGPTPWLGVTLSASPDEPVQFGAVVGGGTPDRLTGWVDSLRQIIIGHNSEAVVDSPPDPLARAIERAIGRTDAVLAWAEFLLPYSAAYPLRLPEDANADLLGPLVAQIRPRAGAVRFAEAQIVTQPRQDWRLDDRGWRAMAARRLQAMRDRTGGMALTSDARALERKLDDPASQVVVRVVVVAETRTAAVRALRDVGAVLGQYAARSGQSHQRFVRASQGIVDLSSPPPATPPRLTWQGMIGAVLVGMALALVAWHWPVGLVPFIQMPASVVPILRWLFSLLWASLPLLIIAVQARLTAQTRLTHWRNRLIARAPRLAPPTSLLLPMTAWWAPAILSVGELGGIWHLPSPNLGALAVWLPARHLPAPPRAFITSPTITVPTGQTSRRITLGHAVRSDGHLAPVGPSLYDLRNIGHLTAGMGAGKSRFFANLCKQVMGDGFTLIDGKGDDAGNLTTIVRQSIRRADEHRVVLLDMTDTDWPIGVNPLAGIALETPGAIDRVTAQIQSIFARLDPEGWSAAPGMQQFLDMGTRLVVETVPLPTVAHVKQALIDETYRTQLLGTCRKLEVNTFWKIIYPSSSDQQKTSMNALMRRFDKLLLSDLVRALMTQQRPTFRFTDAIADQLIVLCPIPHVTYGPLAATAAMLLFQSFMRAAFERPGSATTRRDYPLLVDEFQVLVEHGATQDVAVAITQLRSLGIPTLYAHQALAQVGDLRDLMLINAENRILMRTQEPDASLYARHYAAAGLSGADIASQEPTEHQYARFVVGGQVVGPISIVPLPWPTALTIMPDPYDGPDWPTIRPSHYPPAVSDPLEQIAAMMAADCDEQLLILVYGTPYGDDLALRLAEQMTDDEWNLLNSRWEAIARVQRQYILDHPGCIPDRDERVRWLSRLGYARPRILAEIEFLRIRQAMGMSTLVAQATATPNQPTQRGKGRTAPAPPSDVPPEHWVPNMPTQPAPADPAAVATE